MKKVLIIFPDEWIAYSPSILNLIDELNKTGKISTHVVCFDNGRYPIYESDINASVKIIKISKIIFGCLSLFNLAHFAKRRKLIDAVKNAHYDTVIGIDELGVKTGLSLSVNVHLFSLEIKQSHFLKTLDHKKLNSVVTQTKERYQYVFGDQQRKTFLVQNAPVFTGKKASKNLDKNQLTKIVCFGNLIPQHGIFLCLDFAENSKNISLTLSGRIPEAISRKIKTTYSNLLKENRLILQDSYIPQREVVNYLSKFDIGFCFYDFEMIKKNDFNYISSPSGKLFNYFAAGIPVVANNIIGLKPAKDFDAGILLDKISPETIKSAVKLIEKNYLHHHRSALKAAENFDFHSNIQPFITEILNVQKN